MGKKTKAFRGPNDGYKNTGYVHSIMNEASRLKFPHTVSVGHKGKGSTQYELLV